MFSVDYDATTGLIRCEAHGFLSAADVQQYGTAVSEVVQRSFREFGNITMLCISPETQVQSAETLEAAQREKAKLGPDSRIATVVSSPLARLQAARIFTSENDKAFATEAEARAWLTACRPDRPAAADDQVRKDAA